MERKLFRIAIRIVLFFFLSASVKYRNRVPNSKSAQRINDLTNSPYLYLFKATELKVALHHKLSNNGCFFNILIPNFLSTDPGACRITVQFPF